MRDPLEQYSNTSAKLGGLVQAPRNMHIFGCLNVSIALHSDRKSLITVSFRAYGFNIFTATVSSLHFPWWILPYPPSPICFSSFNSWKSISKEMLNCLGSGNLLFYF